jgi:uncharacterized protein (TIGR02099 family)
MKHILLRIAGHTIRWTWVAATVLAVVAGIAYGAARYYLPTLLDNKASIEQTLEKLSGQKIEIEKIGPWWDGIFPGVRAQGVRVFAPGASQPSVRLDEVRVSISLLPLLQRTYTIHSLVVVHPQVVLERLRDRQLRITGFGPVGVKKPAGQKGEEGAEDSVFMAWLFAQRRMAIEDGVLKWVDDSEPAKTRVRYLTKVNLALENHGQRHHLTFTAAFPEGMCGKCALDVDIDGNPLVGKNWGGRVNIDAIGLNLDALPAVVRTEIPKDIGGQFDLRMRTQWSGGIPRVAQGLVDATNLRLPGLGEGRREIRIDRLRAGIQWRGRLDAWQLDAKHALIGLEGTPWNAGYIRVDHSPVLTRVQIQRVDLAKLAKYATQSGAAREISHSIRKGRLAKYAKRPRTVEEVSDWVQHIHPAGAIDNLIVQYDRRTNVATHWLVQGRLNEIHLEPYKKLPGVNGFSAFLLATERNGELRVNTGLATFRMPWMFRQPIPLRRVLGRIRWERKSDHWTINGRDLRLAGDAVAQGDVRMEIPFDHEKSPHLTMRVSFFGGDVSKASRYYPVNKLHKKLLDWLDQAIVSGEVVGGHLIYDGPTRDYPFKHGEGKFEVQARVHNMVLDYLKGWPPIRGANATVTFRGPGMLITADNGTVRGLRISDVVARKAIVSDKAEPVIVTGRVAGSVETAMDILRHAPPAKDGFKFSRLIAPGLVGSGMGALNLHIEIPHDTYETRISGEYRFLGGGLQLPVDGVRLTDMRGPIHFSHAGIEDGEVTARMFNQPTVVSAKTVDGPGGKETIFRAHGSVRAVDLAATYGQGLGRLISGSTTWNGILRLRAGSPNIEIRSNLAGIHTSLPAPFDVLVTDKPHTVLETVVSDRVRNLMRLQLGSRIGGLFDFRQHAGEWHFDSGQVVLGTTHAQLPGRPGLEVLLRGTKVRGEPWVSFIRAGSGEAPKFLTRVSANIDDLVAFGRAFGKFSLGLNRKGRGWVGSVGGTTAEGAVAVQSTENGTHIAMDLDSLRIPKQVGKDPMKGVDPRTFPSLNLRAKRFTNGSTNLGTLDLSAVHNELGWRIARLGIDRPDMHMRSSGTWYVVVGHDSLDYNLSLKSSDMEQTLDALGLKNLVQGGNLKMDVGLHWREDADRPGLRNLDGTINLTVKSGSILNVDQGAARIAGLFNLRSLAELLTLNFKSAAGFPFSEITGRVAIHGGTAYTDGVTIRGSSANVVARGKVNLINRKLDLTAEIYPNLRAPVTFATGWLWGPQTAALVLALQEIFHKDIEKGTRITYKIAGTMNKPKVTKMASPNEKKETAK